MNADEPQLTECPPRDDGARGAGRPTASSKATVLGVLIAAIVVVEVAKDVTFSPDLGVWSPVQALVCCVLLVGLPFLFARIAPKAAGFDIQWLPGSRRHWLWFVGMVFLLFVATVLVAALAASIFGRPSRLPPTTPVTPAGVVLFGIVAILIVPVAEEIFFRGYVLDQLRKLARPSVAVSIQALLFGLFHLYAWGLFTPLALAKVIDTSVAGLIFGAWRVKFRSLLPLVLTHALLNSTMIISLKARYDQEVALLQPIRHTISRETTRITGPLRKDGAVDYVAELNRRASQGVTPENNAAVLFWQAVGPEEILPEYRDRYFQMLGTRPLPEKGKYFVNLEKYLAGRKEGDKPGDSESEPAAPESAYDLVEPARKRPWTAQEFPVVATWLAANERPLALVVEASRRPRRFDPLVGGEKTSLFAVLQPALSVFHQAGDVKEALVVRAMLRLGEDNVDEAWNDLLACHRLARLVGQGQTDMDAIIAFSLESTVFDGDAAVFRHAPLTASQATRMRDDLERLPPMPDMADALDGAERFRYLEAVSICSREGLDSLRYYVDPPDLKDYMPELDGLELGDKDLKDTIRSLLRYGAETEVDWDLVLRNGNAWFDRLVDAYRKSAAAERREAIGKLDEEFRRLKMAAADVKSLDKAMLDNPREAISERTSQVLLLNFAPDVTRNNDMQDRWRMQFELVKLGFTLAAYRADHGAYPARLDELVPKYASEVPRDLFNDSELQYRLEDGGCLVYSVGFNGRDDGAKGYEDRGKQYDEVDWDDLAVRMSLPESQ